MMRRRIITFTRLIVATVFTVVGLFPIVWTFLTSFKQPIDTFKIPPRWFFVPTSENYHVLLIKTDYPRFFTNSLIVALTSTVLAIALSIPVSYAIARYDFRYKKMFLLSTLLIRMVPPIVIIIPFYILFGKKLGLIDSYPTLILIYLTFNMPYAVWMISTFIKELPKDFEESAMIDGCSRFGAFVHATLPLVLGGVAATAIFVFIMSWNEFVFALILTGRITKTLPVMMLGYITEGAPLWGQLAAASSLSLIPVFVFSLVTQRYIIRGMTFAALKG